MDLDLRTPATIHRTQLPEVPSDSPTYREYQTFRRELPRLLAAGREGEWALIKGDEIVGLFATLDEGQRAGLERYLLKPFYRSAGSRMATVAADAAGALPFWQGPHVTRRAGSVSDGDRHSVAYASGSS
jgi:hypothetical protein